MTEEARKYAKCWRETEVKDCIDFPYAAWTMLNIAADLIESLSAQLEQVTRERDALLKELRGDCGICKHWQECRDSDYSRDVNYNNCWEWRGVEVEE